MSMMIDQQAGTQLLNDDGDASMATALMMSHHGFRRDIAEFALALQQVSSGKRSQSTLPALSEEWRNYRNTLHGHHESEDQRLFPHLKGQNPDIAGVIDALGADHARIDPLLEAGDRAFAELATATPSSTAVDAVLAIVSELESLLDEHLASEERTVIAFLRDAKGFPPPGNDAEADLYAQGFAWASHGIAPEVLERVDAMLPPTLSSRLGEARDRFKERCERVWGSVRSGASTRSIPDWLLAEDGARVEPVVERKASARILSETVDS
jgi:hemerythrin-like domain-containing protein